jgi:hypothetical protein
MEGIEGEGWKVKDRKSSGDLSQITSVQIWKFLSPAFLWPNFSSLKCPLSLVLAETEI